MIGMRFLNSTGFCTLRAIIEAKSYLENGEFYMSLMTIRKALREHMGID